MNKIIAYVAIGLIFGINTHIDAMEKQIQEKITAPTQDQKTTSVFNDPKMQKKVKRYHELYEKRKKKEDEARKELSHFVEKLDDASDLLFTQRKNEMAERYKSIKKSEEKAEQPDDLISFIIKKMGMLTNWTEGFIQKHNEEIKAVLDDRQHADMRKRLEEAYKQSKSLSKNDDKKITQDLRTIQKAIGAKVDAAVESMFFLTYGTSLNTEKRTVSDGLIAFIQKKFEERNKHVSEIELKYLQRVLYKPEFEAVFKRLEQAYKDNKNTKDDTKLANDLILIDDTIVETMINDIKFHDDFKSKYNSESNKTGESESHREITTEKIQLKHRKKETNEKITQKPIDNNKSTNDKRKRGAAQKRCGAWIECIKNMIERAVNPSN